MRYSFLKRQSLLLLILLTVVSVNVRAEADAAGEDDFPPPRQTDYKIQTPTYLSDYFTKSEKGCIATESDGFIRRWMLLEPISKPNRSNTVFTDSYINSVLDSVNFKGQFTDIPQNGSKVKAGSARLTWHALDSRLFNVKLYRFAAALKKPVYGVIFMAVTVIDCPDEIKNVRMSVGSNSASKWWLNGEETVILSGDRRMVADDCVSKRITLRKGRNIIWGAVINGPGMSDFCVRFLDENGNPVTNFTTCFE